MLDPAQYIKEGLKIIDSFIKQGNFQSALNGCRELLKINPYDLRVQKYLQKIQEKIIEENNKKVEEDIDATMHLWKEGRWDDLMKIYAKLYPYAPQNSRLRGLIEKLESKLTKQQKQQKEEFLKKAIEAISKLLKEKRWGDAIQACNELLGMYPLNIKTRDFLKKAKGGLIDQKIAENQRIIESGDFERTLSFLETMLAIDPENKRVKELEMRAKTLLAEQKALAGKMHLNESLVRMKDLFNKAEYEKVIQACEEIERLDPKNITAKFFKKKAGQTMRRESNRLIVKKLEEARAALEPQYAKNPQGFARV